jgi:hypothetical protein
MMMIAPFIGKTVRVLERKKAKMESELGIVKEAFASLNHLTVSVSKPRMAAGTNSALTSLHNLRIA